ncbi:MAG: glycosyltransferase family 39 protein [Candidatus Omnitrophica bacterium]|nr:glycosyltransferase family 39 protein [Candidatus Omnitrophota bacterium]
MLEIIRLILCLAVTSIIGWCVLSLILYKERKPLFEEIALSYGLGMGVITLEAMLFWFVNLKPTLFNILLPWIIIFPIIIFIKPKRQGVSLSVRVRERLHLFDIFLLSGIAIEVFYSFFRALIKPLESYDGIAIYAVRAKVFYEAGGIPQDFFNVITKLFPNSSYPPLLPISESWIYAFMGNFNDLLVKIIFPLYFIAILVVFYFALKELFGRRSALIFTFILAAIPQFNKFSSIGYADFILTFYFTAGFLYLFNWMRTRRVRYLILSAVLLGLSCWTKTEGWALFLACAFILFLFVSLNLKGERKGYLKLILFISAVLVIGLPWVHIVDTVQLENEAYGSGTFGLNRLFTAFLNLDRCPRIAYEFQKQFFGPKKWNIIWIIFLALFALNLKKAFKGEMKYITLLLLFIIAGYGSVYLLMPLKESEPINIYISTSLSRLFIHFTPLCVYWVASVCKKRGYLEI